MHCDTRLYGVLPVAVILLDFISVGVDTADAI